MSVLSPNEYENLFKDALDKVSAENASIEELRIVLADTIVENAIKAQAAESLQNSFNELSERYQTRDKVFQAAWGKAQDFHYDSIMAMQEKTAALLEDARIEYTREFTPEKLDTFVESTFHKLAKPLSDSAHAAGWKDKATDRGKRVAYMRHAGTRQLKTEAFAWFDDHAAAYPRDMVGCATAAFKAVGIEVSTSMSYMREWKKSKRSNL